MNRKSIALACLIAGVIFIPITRHGLIGWLSWPVSLTLLAIAGWLFIQARQTRPAMPYQAESAYRVEEMSDGQMCFHITPASLPKMLPWKVYFGLIIVLPALYLDHVFDTLGLADARMPIFITSLIGLVLVCLVFWALGKESRTHVYPRRIYVSPSVINIPPLPDEKDGKSTMLMTSTIDRFRMEQALENKQGLGMWFGNLYAIALNFSAKSKAKHQNWLADHSYVVEAHAEGKRFVFAGGLDEITAHGIMKAIQRHIGF